MIKCLPQEVQGKLRSGVAVPSLQQCVEELILNSIDAEATCVGVRMDTEALKVQLIDNGTGISAEDMDCVGNRYHTSKCNSVEDLDNLRWYGFRGEALASIVSLATLVEITSRTRSSMTTYVKMFKNGKGLDVFKAETARPSAGTTVIICNFFHNMPVRRKRLDAVLEGERIRHRLEAISLMHPSVSFTLKNDCTGAMMVQLPKAKNTYHRFVQIHSLGRAQKLGEVVYTHGQFEVTGYIGREGHYSNSLQFLYVNERLLLKTRIHKLLNFLLRSLGSSNQKNEKSPDGQTANRSLKHKRSQELYGVYIINIKCSYSEYDICLEPAKTLIEFKDWDGILLCVEEAVKAFMRRENLVAVFSQDDLDYASSELLSLDDAEQEEEEKDKDGQGTSIASTLDCSIGMKLASESVYRKRKGDCVSEDNIYQQSGLTERKEDEDEKIQSKGCIYKEYRDESQFDEVQAAPDSISNITEKEEQTFSSAEEGSRLLCESRSVRQQETEKTQISKEREIQLNNTTPASNVILSDSITQQIEPVLKDTEQLLPDCQGTEGHRQTLISNRKISLSDPFIHPSLPAPCLSQINKLGFQQQNLTQKGVERSFTSKCKISINTAHNRSDTLHKDSAPVVPSKIPRIEPCPRLSLCQETGSLDKFRRIFGKSDKMKLPSLETRSQKNERLPQTTSLILNPLTCQKDQQDSDVAQAGKNETQCKIRSLSTLSAFAKLKPAENKSKISLSAKLCNMKQFKTEDFDVLPDVSGTTSQERTCPGGGNDDQDDNNNENCCDAALNPEPDSDFTTNPELVEKDEDTTSGDWLHHYDTSVGKMVYVNKVTGLSKYEEPATEETQVCCTSDVTNMSVSVISETGMEYRCYPFQVDLVLPFLPKSRTERVISSGLEDRGTSQTDQAVEHVVGDDGDGEDSNSLSSMYSKWKNPVFVRPPMVGVDITSGQADGLAVKIHNILFPYRFSKTMIHSMKVIHQVDKKFLACLINTRDEDPAAQSKTEGNLLVLVDQHAAHERVRLEHLVADSYEDPDASGERRLCSSTVSPPLEISVTEEELRLLRSCQTHLHSLGLEMKFSEAADPQVFVGKVPMCFVEKESNELKRGRSSVIKSIVEEYLREQIELLRSAGRVRGTLPLTVLKVLASLACHGAIKFNDSLNRDECHSLVASLSCCQLPFQCAHGRPSIAPLVDTLHLDKDQKELQKPNLQKLRRLYRAWELYGNR